MWSLQFPMSPGPCSEPRSPALTSPWYQSARRGDDASLLRLTPRKSIEKEYTEEEGHTKSPLEEVEGRQVS